MKYREEKSQKVQVVAVAVVILAVTIQASFTQASDGCAGKPKYNSI